MKRLLQFGIVSAVSLAVVVAGYTPAHASGFEKNIMFGGQTAGVAGIATPYITGSQALYFNPAGLVSDKAGQQDVSFNISPTWDQFKGPINNTNDQVSSSTTMLAPVSLIYGHTLNSGWGYGIGVFVSGGSEADYDSVTFSPAYTPTPSVRTSLKVTELSLGGAYKVNDRLKVGAAWRVSMVNAELQTIQRTSTVAALAEAQFLGLKDNNYTGFRLGAQYKLDDKTMLGFNYRSEVNFAATGTSQLIVATPAGAASSSYGSGTAHTTFPMSATLGAQHEFSDTWTGLVEYNWTQYSRNGQINFDSSIASLDGSTLKLNWLDQHTLRLGADYHGFSWPIRYGLSYISQVTDSSDARANLVAPGPAYGVTLGTGHAFDMGGNTLRVDGALEYETVSGDGNGAASGTTSAGSDVRAGSYATTATAVHLGASYTF